MLYHPSVTLQLAHLSLLWKSCMSTSCPLCFQAFMEQHGTYPLCLSIFHSHVPDTNVKGSSRSDVLVADAPSHKEGENPPVTGKNILYSPHPSVDSRHRRTQQRGFFHLFCLFVPPLRDPNRMVNLTLLCISILPTYGCHKLRTTLG